MTHPLHVPPEMGRRIAEDYLEGKMLVKDICARYGVSTPTVRSNAERYYPRLYKKMKRAKGAYERRKA